MQAVRLQAWWESLRTAYWTVPTVMMLTAILLSFAAIKLDERFTSTFLENVSWVYTGGADGARAVLSTIAASMIGVAGVTFSITIVTLTLASQQFGPRLLRNFLRDVGNQVVLGTFISTFIYCLLVLRTVRGTDEGMFVPHLAVTLGVVLAVLSLAVLIYFIHHVSWSIQASQIIAQVAADLEGAIGRVFPDELGNGEDARDRGAPSLPDDFDEHAIAIHARSSGYIQAVDAGLLMRLATEQDLVIRVDAAPGTFVRAGSIVGRYLSGEPSSAAAPALAAAFLIGSGRTPTQDVTFYVAQLVDLAVRALSPGINDPSTARACVHRLGQAVGDLARRRLPSPYRFDERGVLRAVVHPVTFDIFLDAALDEVRRHGRASVSILSALLEMLADVAQQVPSESRRRSLVRHIELVHATGAQALTDPADRAILADDYRRARAAVLEDAAERL